MLAVLMESITKIIESIIRDIKDEIMYENSDVSSPVVRVSLTTIYFAPNQLIAITQA